MTVSERIINNETFVIPETREIAVVVAWLRRCPIRDYHEHCKRQESDKTNVVTVSDQSCCIIYFNNIVIEINFFPLYVYLDCTVCLKSLTDPNYFLNDETFQNFDKTYDREVGDTVPDCVWIFYLTTPKNYP